MADQHFARLESDERFERNWNRLQTAIEIAVAIIVIAALLGFLGSGPFSNGKSTFGNNSSEMTYAAITRKSSASDLEFTIKAPLKSDKFEIELPYDLLRKVDVVGLTPMTLRSEAEKSGISYSFPVGITGLGMVKFSLKPKSAGIVVSQIRAGDVSAPFHMIILP